MTTPATGTFTYKSWEETPYGEAIGDSKMTRASVTNTFQGDVEGESTQEYLMHYLDSGKGTFIGLEQVVGKVGGRSGSFVLEQRGTFEGETVKATWTVVPGSGSGELAGLRGEGGFVAKSGVKDTPFTLDYAFE